MKKSDINLPPMYFDRYIDLYEDVDLETAFQQSIDELASFDWEKCRRIGLTVYAPGKWTIADILQHLIDWERIMTYRALGFSREMFWKAPGHDENEMAEKAGASVRSLDDLLEEMSSLRQSTRQFFHSLSEEHLLKRGVCWESEMSPLALAFTILGHQRSHFRVIKERYFPMV